MSPSHDAHEGGCLCGGIRYAVHAPLADIVHCHCTMCRQASGAPVTTWVTVPRGALEWRRGEAVARRSSDHAERLFCPDCGAQIAFRTSHDPDGIDITVATLDCAADHPASRHIWTANRLPWLRLDDGLPEYPEAS